MMANSASNKNLPLWLGFGGLIPFVALACGVALAAPGRSSLVTALLVYAAVILSFLGGVIWGRMLAGDSGALPTHARHFLYSVIPALVGWLALFLKPGRALVVLALAFAGAFLYDRHLATQGLLPHWYLRMRIALTSVVVLSLLTAAWFV